MAARSRALAAESRDAIRRSRERIDCTSRMIAKTHSLPDFRLSSQEVGPELRNEAIEASMSLAQQREIDREAGAWRAD